MEHHTFKLNKVMIPEPRLTAVSNKGKLKWTTFTKDMTVTVLIRSSSSVEIHLIQDGKFIIKQSFNLLSSSSNPPPFRKITHGPLSLSMKYDSIQTPFLSGLKMRETFQIGFVVAEEFQSFLKLMNGYFTFAVHNAPPNMKTPNNQSSQITPTSPTRSTASSGLPFSSPMKSTITSSPTKSTKSQSPSQSKTTPSPRKRTKSNKKSQPNEIDRSSNESQSNNVSPPVITQPAGSPVQTPLTHSSELELGEEATPTPSPPHDDATERLKRALLGNFTPSPPGENLTGTGDEARTSLTLKSKIESSKHTQVDYDQSISKINSTNVDANNLPSVKGEGTGQEIFNQPLPTALSDETTPLDHCASHNLTDGSSGTSQLTKNNVNTNSQPLIIFSPCLDPSPIHSLTEAQSGDSSGASSKKIDSTLQSNYLDDLEDLLGDGHPVLLNTKEAEAERVRKGKRKREEMEDELEEESQGNILDNKHSPPDSKLFQTMPLPHGLGVYDLPSKDLEKLVEDVIMEKGFEMLVNKIQSLVDTRLEAINGPNPPLFHPPQHGLQNNGWSDINYARNPACWQQHPHDTNQFINPNIHTHPDNMYHDHYSHAQYQHQYPYPVQSTQAYRQYPTTTHDHELSQFQRSSHQQEYSEHPQTQLTYHQANTSTQYHHNEDTQATHYPEYDYDNERFELYESPSKRSSRSSAFETASQTLHVQVDNTPYPTTDDTYLPENKNLDEDEDEIANISREFDNGFSPLQVTEEEEVEKEYDYDNELAEEGLELEKDFHGDQSENDMKYWKL